MLNMNEFFAFLLSCIVMVSTLHFIDCRISH